MWKFVGASKALVLYVYIDYALITTCQYLSNKKTIKRISNNLNHFYYLLLCNNLNNFQNIMLYTF